MMKRGVRHSLIYMVLLPINQVVVPRSPQRMKRMRISGSVNSLNKTFLPNQSFQSFFKGQHWVRHLSSSVEKLSCLPKVGEKLWKLSSKQLLWNQRNTCRRFVGAQGTEAWVRCNLMDDLKVKPWLCTTQETITFLPKLLKQFIPGQLV